MPGLSLRVGRVVDGVNRSRRAARCESKPSYCLMIPLPVLTAALGQAPLAASRATGARLSAARGEWRALERFCGPGNSLTPAGAIRGMVMTGAQSAANITHGVYPAAASLT